ncbi:hypothetical protein PSQ90_06300 [Devosia rhodophyticola]|uniref:PepSY domain-containing protein n=1 Tax=Devosia rhodophyticola TaxID=3026423 RepID=A0ABY7Z1F2_9HYPH|nr:hypothetical protein [Devosia rhodophyticola]WDR07045.1 hypothetical protein PSQ90_06300 [Devosia rhodophyticola]
MKKTIIALVTVASLAGVVAPAFASTSPFGDGNDSAREFAAETILTRLQDKGVAATSVEEWGDLVRAWVKTNDGKTEMKYFTPDSLTPVTL